MGSRNRAAGAAAVLAAALLAGGCATNALPPKLSDDQAERVRATHFAARVAVEAYEPALYSERLIRSLRSTGLFDQVGPLGAVEDPDLVASVDRPIYGTASMLPLLTVVSLGIIPTFVSQEWGEDFTLRAPDDADRRVPIELAYEGPTTLGWLALLRAPTPRHTLRKPHETPRFRAGLAYAIVERSDAVRDLLGPPAVAP